MQAYTPLSFDPLIITPTFLTNKPSIKTDQFFQVPKSPKMQNTTIRLSNISTVQNHILFLLLTLLFFNINSNAQSPGIEVLARPEKESIQLRWAPNTPATWKLANKYGYVVERFTILRDGEIPSQQNPERLTPTPMRPMPLAEWEPYSDNRYVAIAASCIFDSTETEAPTGMANPHEIYRQYKEKQHRYSFAMYAADQSLLASELSGLYWEDKSAQSNEKYLYLVYINCPDSLAVDTGSVFTGISEYQPLPPPQKPKAKWGNKKVDLSWNILYLGHMYNSYIVERSIDEGKNYQSISNNALVQLTDENVTPEYMYRTDSLPDNKTTVHYRIRGINAFGMTGPPSESVSGHGLFPIKSAPVITEKKLINNEKVLLKWEYPEKMNPFITGFRVYQSPSPDGKRRVVYEGTDPERRSYTDTIPDMTNYYLISVYNQTTEKVSPQTTYAARIDSFPPAMPQQLTGEVDTTGLVTLHWSANSDRDLEGYRVYSSNHPKYEFMLITPSVITDTTFRDSINIKTLTKHVFYKIRAIDVRQNQSQFSEMLTLKRPDIIPPVAPQIEEVISQKNIIKIRWLNSKSDDVAQHHIYRRTFPDSAFVKTGTVQQTTEEYSSFEDENTTKRGEYAYYIRAEDETGLLSPPSNHGYINPSSEFNEEIKLKKKDLIDKVELTWEVDAIKKVRKIVVYRSIEEGPLRLYGNSESDEFVDDILSPGKTYQYLIKAVYEDGSSSPMSNRITVKM